MPDAIVYCDNCNKIILPSSIQEGRALVSVTKSLCEDCLKAIGPDEREQLMSLSKARAGKDTPGTIELPLHDSGTREDRAAHRTSGRLANAGTRPSSWSSMTMPAVGIAAALVGAAVTLVLMSDSGESTPRGGNEKEPKPDLVAPAPTVPSPEGGTAAAQQLAMIKEMRASDLYDYAETRRLLSLFPQHFAGAPEVEEAKALLLETDVALGKLADKKLEEAMEGADQFASHLDFDEAVSAIDSVETRFSGTPWLKETGAAKIAELRARLEKDRAAWVITNAADVLEKARAGLEDGRLEEAAKHIADRAEWPADLRAKAETLAAEIERKRAAAEAAKRLEAERETILATFDRLMIDGEFAAARTRVEAKAEAGGKTGEMLRVAGRVAGAMADSHAATVRGAGELVERKATLKLAKGRVTGVVKDVSDEGIVVATTYTINNQARERSITYPWSALRADQRTEFEKRGGLTIEASDRPIIATYTARASGNLDAASQAVQAAGEHPLAAWLSRVIREHQTRLAYESAMENAEELIEKESWKEALAACKKALELKPNDPAAIELFAKVELHVGPPRTLTLDLGPSTELGTGGRVTMELVYIRPGTFVMGSDRGPRHGSEPSGKPKHEVTITKGFYLGTYEVTQAQYEKVMGENRSQSKEQNRPVTHMTWKGAARFCQKASETTRREVRLPTEAEWEYACRAGTTTEWSHGNDEAKLGKYAWYNANAGGATHPVGQKKPNAWGLYDMHGNAAEFVANDPAGYKPGPRVDAYTTGSSVRRVFRGGGCGGGAYSLRSAYRCQTKIFRPAPVGFRVVVTNTGAEDLEPVTSASE